MATRTRMPSDKEIRFQINKCHAKEPLNHNREDLTHAHKLSCLYGNRDKSQPSRATRSLERTKFMEITGVLTGHCRLLKDRYDSATCPSCGFKDETATHFFFARALLSSI